MKLLLLAIFCSLGALTTCSTLSYRQSLRPAHYFQTEQESGYDSRKALYSAYVEEYLNNRQRLKVITEFEGICPGKGESMIDALSEVEKCADGIPEDTETLCSLIKNHFMQCSKPVIQVFENCLPDEAPRDIPRMIFESIKSATDFVCKSDGEHIFELINTCARKSPARHVNRCVRQLSSTLRGFKKQVPTKAEFCHLLLGMKPCWALHLSSSCGHKITREAFVGLFDALYSPCADVEGVSESTELTTRKTFHFSVDNRVNEEVEIF